MTFGKGYVFSLVILTYSLGFFKERTKTLSFSSQLFGGYEADGAVKLNCDASTMEPDDVIGFCCVIRDSRGVWQWGCADIIPPSSVFQGELFVIWRGFRFTWETGFKEVLCETDCHEAFSLLKDTLIVVCSEASDLILRIRELLHCSWRAEIALIQRTANCIADALAKHTLKQRIHHAD
ncbi:hypothetical protein PIB30_054329 [Stylosanthes scabra]|uniref:RNase H type-1 domain-containing protein n=1 Tax=Stylosanthes scabra TaxID=79078 RepID=A0ABU6VL66_9FABA|nr:hypothetical protein [Stylosanthes scabra]